ncbi:zinc-binding dehydrogenase [Candidatus Poribacteria bacterium]|jgi:L-iditol 2-dehydrogenase|nr:zinc-binding dehydrogenase [Candidatus Poribacteria bacterium]MBT5532161.1 zinc-binding dehydrogenase [Candidatus Poribacteria bacterium]MBT5713394.1 zinc-binding dehydrogenase [Candidatus Poribacteria bacterium]MBT7100138.1 zinc-binding dehydrogenase [Candidatus Poribacteria bacterium]MBT7806981.1 zinc-binding dehydrogenase [Candidatus Poribacteria bacterium]
MKGLAKLARGHGNVGLMDAAEPSAMPGHVVIEVAACGVCGTDIHIHDDEFPTVPPVIMGHELAGIVADIGEGVTRCAPGDRVTSETYFHVCGSCDHCRDGRPNLCAERKSIGSGVNGAFARYVLVPEQNVHALPDGLTLEAGALTEPLACCVHAVEMTKLEPSDVAVISGPGAIGLLTSQVVNAAGATTVVLGTSADERRLAVARSLGADHTLNVDEIDPAPVVRDMTGGYGADIVFECSGSAPSAATCLDLVRRSGRYAQVGLFGKPIAWDLEQVCYKELAVSGSNATVPSAWRKALSLMRDGKVDTAALISDRFALDDWRQAFDVFAARSGLKTLLDPQA